MTQRPTNLSDKSIVFYAQSRGGKYAYVVWYEPTTRHSTECWTTEGFTNDSSRFKSWRYSEKEAAEVISRKIVSSSHYDGINYIVCKNTMAEPVILADGSVAKQSVQCLSRGITLNVNVKESET